MKTRIYVVICFIFFYALLTACTSDNGAEDMIYKPADVVCHNSNDNNEKIRGRVVYINGIECDAWIIPDDIDWISLEIECDNGQQAMIIILGGTSRYGEIAVESKITVYWLKDAPVFDLGIPTYIASRVVVDGIEYDYETKHFIWQLYNVSSLWSDNPIRNIAFPEMYSREMFEVLQLPIIAYGRKLDEKPLVMDDGTIMVPLQSSIGWSALGLISIGLDDFDDGSLTMAVTDGSIAGIRTIAVGSTIIVMAGERMVLCTPPIVVEGIVYVPFLSFFRDARPFIFSYAEIFSDRLEIVYSID